MGYAPFGNFDVCLDDPMPCNASKYNTLRIVSLKVDLKFAVSFDGCVYQFVAKFLCLPIFYNTIIEKEKGSHHLSAGSQSNLFMVALVRYLLY